MRHAHGVNFRPYWHTINMPIHVGIIPDGNRRWCAANDASLTDLAMRHVVSLVSLASSHASVCVDHPCLAQVDELSIYLLSLDNMKRTDATTDMVSLVAECAYALLALLSFCRSHPVVVVEQLVECDDFASITFGTKAIDAVAQMLPPDASAFARLLTEYFGAFAVASEEVHRRLPKPWSDALREAGRKESAAARIIRIEVDAGEDDAVTLRCRSAFESRVAKGVAAMQTDIPRVALRLFGVDAALSPRARVVKAASEHLMSDGNGCSGESGTLLRINVALAYDPIEDARAFLADASGSRRQIDLVVRTSGERRSSGFFCMQTLYSEWFYCKKLFPDFGVADMVDVLTRFAGRQRRFGR